MDNINPKYFKLNLMPPGMVSQGHASYEWFINSSQWPETTAAKNRCNELLRIIHHQHDSLAKNSVLADSIFKELTQKTQEVYYNLVRDQRSSSDYGAVGGNDCC